MSDPRASEGFLRRWRERAGDEQEPVPASSPPHDPADDQHGWGTVDVTPARTSRRDLAGGGRGEDPSDQGARLGAVLNHLATLERLLLALESRLDASVADLTTRVQADVRRLGADVTEATDRLDEELSARTREINERVNRFGETHHGVLTDLVAQNNAIAQGVARLEAMAVELRQAAGELTLKVDAHDHQLSLLRNQLKAVEDADVSRFSTLQEGEEQIVERLGDLVQEVQAWRRRIAVRAEADRSHEPPAPSAAAVEQKRGRRWRRGD